MNRLWWWLVELISGFLDSNERQAVLGDILESGDSGVRAFSGVLGLVARRQCALWRNWRPWAVLIAVILPLGFLLSIISRRTSDDSAVSMWMYLNNWDWALTKNPGFWRVLGQSSLSVFLTYLALGCWSWVGGFVLGFLSRGMERVNSLLLCMMLILGQLGAPRYFDHLFEYQHRVFGLTFPNRLPESNAAVFAIAFYRVLFPLIVQVLLVAIPALWGMRQAMSELNAGRFLHIAIAIGAMATLMQMVTHAPGFWVLVAPRITGLYPEPAFWNPILHVRRLLEPIKYWPIMFLMAHAIRKRSLRAVVV